MVNIDPYVRLMLLCDDIAPSPENPRRFNVLGLAHHVKNANPGEYPIHLHQLVVYLRLVGGRGNGEGKIVVATADDIPIFSTPLQVWTYPQNPLLVLPVVFRVRECRFPTSGVYWVQFWHRGRQLQEMAIQVE